MNFTAKHQLNDSQLSQFLHQNGIDKYLASFFRNFAASTKNPVRKILDCGGGDGQYLDFLLDIFPDAEGVLVDSAQFMLDRNKPHPRKKCVLENLEDMKSLICDDSNRFDMICFTDVLHHCIVDSYRGTRALQSRILSMASQLLTKEGYIIICERVFESWVTAGFSTKLIYYLTKNKWLGRFLRFFGANTGGVGVCFLSHQQFLDILGETGLKVSQEVCLYQQRYRYYHLIRFLALGIKQSSYRLFRLENHGSQ
jgi:ubiquinone/menaquinone biosynthesis C-methylase UbiE